MTKSFGQKLRQLIKPRENYPHTCPFCQYFRGKPNGNRGCKYLGKLVVENGVCMCWILEPDPKRRRLSMIELP